MGTLTIFLVKSVAISGILAAWYMLALRGKALHRYNRFFLLTALVVSLVVPFLHLRSVELPAPVTARLLPVSMLTDSAPDVTGAAGTMQQVQESSFSWTTGIAIGIGAVSLFMLGILLLRVARLLLLCKKHPVKEIEGARLLLTDHANAPFTFLDYLIWNKTMSMDTEIGSLILRHELTHIAQRHTYDKLFCQALTCIFWFNPFYWLIQRELDLVHEFIADEQAVADRDTETFSLMLLHSYSNGSFLHPQHHFTASPVRRRLAMLQQAAKPSFARLRRLMALPLLAGTTLLFAFSVHSGVPSAHIAPAKKKLVVLLDAAHGGVDAGGQHNGLMEKDICLQYARRMKQLAPQYNIDVRLTRKEDKYLTLSNRVAMADNIRPDVFISLHVADEPGTMKEKGDIDIYVSNRNTHAEQCQNYGAAILQAMEQDGVIPGASKCDHAANATCDKCKGATGQQSTTRSRATEKDGIYVLKNVKTPSMVIILGNMKNSENMQLVTREKHVDDVCNAILKGIASGTEEPIRTGMNSSSVLGSNTLAALQGTAAATPKCSPSPSAALKINVDGR